MSPGEAGEGSDSGVGCDMLIAPAVGLLGSLLVRWEKQFGSFYLHQKVGPIT